MEVLGGEMTVTLDPQTMAIAGILDAEITKRAQGTDISNWQTEWTPQEHQDFVIIKASDGVTKNSLYDQHFNAANDAGMIIGAYHYFRSGIPWENQVTAFISAQLYADFLALDFEQYGNTASVTFALDALNFLEELDKPALLYSNPATIQEWMFQLGVYWPQTYDNLWIAQWPYYGWNDRMLEVPYPEYGWEPRLPAGCTAWRFWQYSADCNCRGDVGRIKPRL